jgi:hypothetical protein
MNDAVCVSSDGSECNFIAKSSKPANMSLLKRFMCMCTAKKVMTLGIHWEVFGKFRLNLGSAQKKQMSTWYPKNYVGLFMIGLPDDQVAFYVHETQQMYSMSCNIDTPKIPDGTVLCLNYTEDVHIGIDSVIVKSPRMLIFDIIMLKGERINCTAEKRYGLLRQFHDDHFKSIESVSILFTLQWVGYYTHAHAFVDGTIKMDHKVGGIMALTDNGLRPIRTIRVKLPMIVFDQNAFLRELQKAGPETVPVKTCRSIEGYKATQNVSVASKKDTVNSYDIESNKCCTESKKNANTVLKTIPSIKKPELNVKKYRKNPVPCRAILQRTIPSWFPKKSTTQI